MKLTHTLIITSLACITAAQGAALLIDFDNNGPAAPGNTQAGWEAFSDSGDGAASNKSVNYSGYTDLASGNITVTTTGVTHTRNYNNGGGTAPNFPGGDLDRVYNDMILSNTLNPFNVAIAGLAAGTFQITTHHLAQGSVAATTSNKSSFDILVTDADSAAFSQDEGNFLMGAGSTTTFFAPTVHVFEVTSNGTDAVILRIDPTLLAGGGQGAWTGLSGLEIAAVPEPSSTALLGLGGLALIFRRRK